MIFLTKSSTKNSMHTLFAFSYYKKLQTMKLQVERICECVALRLIEEKCLSKCNQKEMHKQSFSVLFLIQ